MQTDELWRGFCKKNLDLNWDCAKQGRAIWRRPLRKSILQKMNNCCPNATRHKWPLKAQNPESLLHTTQPTHSITYFEGVCFNFYNFWHSNIESEDHKLHNACLWKVFSFRVWIMSKISCGPVKIRLIGMLFDVIYHHQQLLKLHKLLWMNKQSVAWY